MGKIEVIKTDGEHKRVVLKGNESTETPLSEKPAPTTYEHEYFDPDNIHSDGTEFDDDGTDRD